LGPFFFHFFDGGADERLIQSVTKTLFDLIDGLERRNEANLAAFLETLQIAIEKKTIDDTQGAGLPSGRVRIMTIHTAKGLEFPAVAVPGIKNPPNRKGDFHLSDGGLFVSGGEDWKRGLEDCETFEKERADREQEERCLLYVAITRARDHLYLSSPFANGMERGEKTNLFSSVIGALSRGDLPHEELREAPGVTSRLTEAVDEPAETSVGESASRFGNLEDTVEEWEAGRQRLEAVEAKDPVDMLRFVNWSGLFAFAQCPLRYYYRQVGGMEHLAEVVEDDDSETTDGYRGGRRADGVDEKAFGSFVHQFLSDWALGKTGVEKPDRSARKFLEELAVRYCLPAKQRATVVRRAVEIIRAFSDTSLADRSAVAYVERPIYVRLDRVVFRGVMDRVDGVNGRYRIIDYKGKSERADHMFQVQFYAWALGRLGDRPVTDGLLCYLRSPTGVVDVDVTAAALTRIDDSARLMDEAVGSGRFEPSPGEVCRICPFNILCPAAEHAPEI
jgi:ATP-dependent exoDNAse (exonuclease V) beta subunit